MGLLDSLLVCDFTLEGLHYKECWRQKPGAWPQASVQVHRGGVGSLVSFATLMLVAGLTFCSGVVKVSGLLLFFMDRSSVSDPLALEWIGLYVGGWFFVEDPCVLGLCVRNLRIFFDQGFDSKRKNVYIMTKCEVVS